MKYKMDIEVKKSKIISIGVEAVNMEEAIEKAIKGVQFFSADEVLSGVEAQYSPMWGSEVGEDGEDEREIHGRNGEEG